MSAILSQCGRYRYTLLREHEVWHSRTMQMPMLIGVNPSTADAHRNDATIRKDLGFTKRWDCRGFVKGNVFAYRATDVRVLGEVDDPVGPQNLEYLLQLIAMADVLIPCWGNVEKVPRHLRHQFDIVRKLLYDSGKPVMVFGLTQNGSPLHPLMLSYATELREWK